MTRQTSESQEVNVQTAKVDAFGERISLAIRRTGGAKKMAEKTGMSTSVLRSWRAEKSDPSRTSLVKVARAAGVSLEWLATGEGDPDKGAGEPVGLGEGDVDLDALEDVAVRVLTLLEQRRPDLSARARARIVRLVYEFYIRQEKPMDEASLDNVIELAAFKQ